MQISPPACARDGTSMAGNRLDYSFSSLGPNRKPPQGTAAPRAVIDVTMLNSVDNGNVRPCRFNAQNKLIIHSIYSSSLASRGKS